MREKLPHRRPAEVIDFVHRLPGGSAQPMTATIGFFGDGRPSEIFIDPPKLTNDAANLARDVALLISIALQHGVEVEEMRTAVGRAEDGTPHSIAGSALDLLGRETVMADVNRQTPQPPHGGIIPPVAVDVTGPELSSAAMARHHGYTGSTCVHCESMRMKIAGHCEVCEDCGESSGCS